MTPVASRNVANILIFVGLVPILLWLFLLALSFLHPEAFLPWVSAGIIMFGMPLGMLSVFIALPMMMLARNRAAANPTVWTRFHRLPFFFGVATFVVAVIAGIWLVSNNFRRGEARQPESMKTVAAFEIPLPSEADRDQFLSVLRAAAEVEGMHVDATSKGDLEQEAKVSPNFQMTMNAAVWRSSNDNEAVASAMDQFDHLGQVWLVFSRGEDPAMAIRFRERAMHEIMLHWPSTLSLPIMSTGAIPLHRDLIRTPTGYIVKPSEAHKYDLTGTKTALRAAGQQEADALVQQLSGLPAELPSGPHSWLCNPAPAPCSPPPLPPDEAKRQSIYDQLFALGSASVPALARALGSQDVSLRSNAALALGVLGGGWWTSSNRAQAKIDISAALPALTTALQDPDSRTRALAAQDLGDIGAHAAPAVPALVKLLASDDEGLRNSACIGLRGIGAPAADALPALRSALSDPSRDVRRFAELAIASIEGRLSQ